MLKFLYGLSIRGYVGLLHVAAFFSPKARLWVQGRKDWRMRLSERMGPVTKAGRKTAWFHAASLGEFEQGRPVIEAFKRAYPDYFIVLTFFSPSGYEIRKSYAGADYICYLPADTAANAREFVNLVKPEIALFVKYEFWYNYLKSLADQHIPILLFSAIFRPEQVFFKSWGGFYRSWLTLFSSILVQDQASARLLRQVEGIREVIPGGDTRFDRAKQLLDNRRELPEISAFAGEDVCLVVGSAWGKDMQLLIPVLNRLGTRLKAIVAPHEINADELSEWERQLDLPSLRYSEYRDSGFVSPENAPNYLFIDNIGMLSSLYGYGKIAYIGGAFGKGLHNTLEAATYGMPVFFGNKNYLKFSEAVALRDAGIAVPVDNSEAFEQAVLGLLADPGAILRIAADSREFVAARTGATGTVMGVVKRFIA